MKLNNKGMTLVELIVSVALLSIIMGFLFKIILDVKYEKDLSGYADQNQINRAEIIKMIQEDILALGFRNYVYESNKKIKLNFDDSTSDTIEVSSDGKSITYNGRNWTIKDADYNFGIIEVNAIGDEYVQIIVPVISSIEDDSSIDDIEILAKY